MNFVRLTVGMNFVCMEDRRVVKSHKRHSESEEGMRARGGEVRSELGDATW